jgi:hypothetical protein
MASSHQSIAKRMTRQPPKVRCTLDRQLLGSYETGPRSKRKSFGQAGFRLTEMLRAIYE